LHCAALGTLYALLLTLWLLQQTALHSPELVGLNVVLHESKINMTAFHTMISTDCHHMYPTQAAGQQKA
jgi:hypothetical protein